MNYKKGGALATKCAKIAYTRYRRALRPDYDEDDAIQEGLIKMLSLPDDASDALMYVAVRNAVCDGGYMRRGERNRVDAFDHVIGFVAASNPNPVAEWLAEVVPLAPPTVRAYIEKRVVRGEPPLPRNKDRVERDYAKDWVRDHHWRSA
jgi:hypothetical protein